MTNLNQTHAHHSPNPTSPLPPALLPHPPPVALFLTLRMNSQILCMVFFPRALFKNFHFPFTKNRLVSLFVFCHGALMFPFSVIKEQFGFSYMQNGVRFLSFSQPQAALTLHCGDSCFTFFTSINQPFFVRMFRQIIYIFILSCIMFVSK